MTDGKDTAVKTKPLISKENAQNRPETIQRGQVLGVSAFREQIGNSAAKRRCLLCPVCRNTSRENGRSFLMSVAGRNITSFAGNAKGAASRASVPPLSNSRTIYRKGEQDNDRLSKQHSHKAGNHQGKRDHTQGGALAVVSPSARSHCCKATPATARVS